MENTDTFPFNGKLRLVLWCFVVALCCRLSMHDLWCRVLCSSIQMQSIHVRWRHRMLFFRRHRLFRLRKIGFQNTVRRFYLVIQACEQKRHENCSRNNDPQHSALSGGVIWIVISHKVWSGYFFNAAKVIEFYSSHFHFNIHISKVRVKLSAPTPYLSYIRNSIFLTLTHVHGQ